MNCTEMHIELAQGTQNISANVRRKFLDAEMDWVLNKMQQRFIQSKVRSKQDGSGGFQIDEMNSDAIRPLIKTSPVLDAAIRDITDYEVLLPADYSYLLSDDSRSYLLCGQTVAKVSTSTNVLKIPFAQSAKSSSPFYQTIVLVLGADTYSLADIKTYYGTAYNGLSSKDEKYVIVDLLLWYLRNVIGLNVYWEKYGTLYAPQTFLFIGKTVGSITVDAQTTVNGTLVTVAGTKYNSTVGNWNPNRLTVSSSISTLQVTPFYKSTDKSPISELEGEKIIIYADGSFIITGVSLQYLRKPRRIELLLNQDCELPEEFHQAICDLAVEYFKVMTQDPGWEMKLRDNMSRSPILP